jgi:hypothetical protein
MDAKQKGCAVSILWVLLTLVAVYIFTIVTTNRIYREQTEIIGTGMTTEATIERVTHKGLWELGKIYARLEYTVDGQAYAKDVQISMRTYQFPTGKVKDGKTVVTISYLPEDPSMAGFEGAVLTAKTARTLSIVFLCIVGPLALLLIFGLAVVGLSDR